MRRGGAQAASSPRACLARPCRAVPVKARLSCRLALAEPASRSRPSLLSRSMAAGLDRAASRPAMSHASRPAIRHKWPSATGFAGLYSVRRTAPAVMPHCSSPKPRHRPSGRSLRGDFLRRLREAGSFTQRGVSMTTQTNTDTSRACSPAPREAHQKADIVDQNRVEREMLKKPIYKGEEGGGMK